MATSTVPTAASLGDAEHGARIRPDSAESATGDGVAAAGAPRRVILRTVGLLALLVGTGLLYLWNLSASGYANSFYSAAVQAGSQSWKAFFFGSLDAGNAITVDKPPASLWLMALSVRIFGLSSWSILAPQALLGVGTVGVLYAGVRRTSGHLAGLLAGALLALTPVAALMFRFNNPDALLVFLLTAAGYATLRATERGQVRWLAAAGVLVGFAFLAKMLQAFLVLPAFVGVYLLFAAAPLLRRVLHLLIAFGAMLVSLGWWVAIVELTPTPMRPYVGGSDGNSVLELIFGYNGFARILGDEASGGPGGQRAVVGGFSGPTGVTRLFDGVSGGMVSWLVPAALVLAAVALLLRRRAPRTDLVRAGIVLWAGWLVVSASVFSFMAGIYHDYYTVALAPAIAALVAVGAVALWGERGCWLARVGLAGAALTTGASGFLLIAQAPQPYASLRWPIAALSALGAIGTLLLGRLPKSWAGSVTVVTLLGATVGPASYALQTVATPHTGSIVTAGPVTSDEGGFGRGPRTPYRAGGAGVPTGIPGDPGGQAGPGTEDGTVVGEVAALLQQDAGDFTWVAATNGSRSSARYQLATRLPVMAIGGFSGSDPCPTLAGFQQLVSQGRIHYYLVSGGRVGGGPGGGSASAIASWVVANFTATTVDGVTLYDLTTTT